MIIDKLNKNDYIKLGFQWFWTVILSSFLCYFSTSRVDVLFVYSLFSLLYIVCFAYAFEHFYVFEENGMNVHQGLARCTKWYCICLLLCTITHLVPYEIHLYLVVGALMCSVVPTHLGLVQSILIVLTIQMCGETNPYEILYAMMLIMLGMMCSSIFKKHKYSFESSLIIGAISVSSYFMSTYCTERDISIYMALHGILEGVINLSILIFAVPFLNINKENLQLISFGEAIEDDFAFVQEIKSISPQHYKHGRIVSLLAYTCAKQIGLDENLACCAGLYYNFCDSDVKEPIKHAISMAEKYNLPVEVRRILKQYKGIEDVISIREAALIDLIDEVVTVFEKRNSVEESVFDKHMLIMNRFEELSASGRYDESGLSINMFLKIRKFLIEEVDFHEYLLRE